MADDPLVAILATINRERLAASTEHHDQTVSLLTEGSPGSPHEERRQKLGALEREFETAYGAVRRAVEIRKEIVAHDARVAAGPIEPAAPPPLESDLIRALKHRVLDLEAQLSKETTP